MKTQHSHGEVSKLCKGQRVSRLELWIASPSRPLRSSVVSCSTQGVSTRPNYRNRQWARLSRGLFWQPLTYKNTCSVIKSGLLSAVPNWNGWHACQGLDTLPLWPSLPLLSESWVRGLSFPSDGFPTVLPSFVHLSICPVLVPALSSKDRVRAPVYSKISVFLT